jgi:uncharacterized membrane protein
MQTSDFETLTVAELIVTAGRLKKCRDSLEEIAEEIKKVSVIVDNTLDWLAKDESEKRGSLKWKRKLKS